MTIRTTIQTQVANALSGPLVDAATEFLIWYEEIGSGEYDPSDLSFTQAARQFLPTTRHSESFTNGRCRGVLQDAENDDFEGGIKFDFKVQYLYVLDSELNSHRFNFETRRYYVEIDSETYQIFDEQTDPTRSLRTLFLRTEQDAQ